MKESGPKETSALEETRWTDASIRWPEDGPKTSDSDDEEEEECGYMDPFKDPDPFKMFSFKGERPGPAEDFANEADKFIDINIRGYKTDADQIWESTGLTLWRASDYLCEYQMKNNEIFQGKRVLELGAGLGLNGILAWRMTNGSTICITDGDSDALVHLRDNIDRNRPEIANENESNISCHQLIWGQETSTTFLEHHGHGQTFDVLLASDIIYAKCIIEPLWETIKTLLSRPNGVFVMAFARRKVPISIEYVLESSVEAGFVYELAEEDSKDGIWVYLFRFQNDEDTK